MNYVYIQSEPNLWTVGFYDPSGKWHPERDCDSEKEASGRVHWLNGGADSSGEIVAVEFGFKCCEKGLNLQATIQEAMRLSR